VLLQSKILNIKSYRFNISDCNNTQIFLDFYIVISSESTIHLFTEWQYHMLHVYNCIFLKMSTLRLETC